MNILTLLIYYTNVMAKYNLKWAAKCYELFKKEQAQSEIIKRLG
ncbi:hypothetical protein [Sporanaerobium hydrogeniformans]|nr:hypothetical protein [Sporanaerobium hydrogeniformans]